MAVIDFAHWRLLRLRFAIGFVFPDPPALPKPENHMVMGYGFSVAVSGLLAISSGRCFRFQHVVQGRT